MKPIKTTLLSDSDILPLTCSRTGTCCHGNQVWINPWEVQQLAKTKQISASKFCKTTTDFGGIRLKFDGNSNSTGKKSCLLYHSTTGCSVHVGRPLACRMYPLGRQIQHGETRYVFQGDEFPCFNECPEVKTLPQLSVHEYLIGQNTKQYEIAQTGYLEVVQNIADNAFALLLDTPLASSRDKNTLKAWRKLSIANPTTIYSTIEEEWLNALLYPLIDYNEDPTIFIEQHNEYLQQKIQACFGSLTTKQEFSTASILLMNMALYLAMSIGANSKELAEHWIEVAKEHGALE